MRTIWTGVGTALVTPFTSTGDLDEQAVRRLGRRQIDAGIHFLVPCGTTGENPTLTLAERLRIVEILVDEAHGQLPVLAGAGGYNTKEVIHLAGEMLKAGASGLLSVTPYYNKPTQEGLYQHFRAIAESTPLPIVLYNVPGRTGVNLDPSTVVRLAAIPNIVGVKEASGNISQMCELCHAVPPGFIVLSGDDAITLPLMAIGGRGVISVASNEIPSEMVDMVEAAESGDFAAARRLHERIMPLMKVNFVEANPGPVKAAMAAMGLLEESYRLPVVGPRPGAKEQILKVLGGARHPQGFCTGRHDRGPPQRMTLESDIAELVAAVPGAAAPTRVGRARPPNGDCRSPPRHRQIPRFADRHQNGARSVDPIGTGALDLVGLTQSLVDIDSTTGREAAAGRWLSSYLRQLGYTVTEQRVDDARFNVLATSGRPTVVLSTHYDCVPPFFKSRVEDGRIFGRGSCDAKGILAAQIAASERLRADGETRVGLLFVVGEERGSDGARVANDAAASPGPISAANIWLTANRPTAGSAPPPAAFCGCGWWRRAVPPTRRTRSWASRPSTS